MGLIVPKKLHTYQKRVAELKNDTPRPHIQRKIRLLGGRGAKFLGSILGWRGGGVQDGKTSEGGPTPTNLALNIARRPLPLLLAPKKLDLKPFGVGFITFFDG